MALLWGNVQADLEMIARGKILDNGKIYAENGIAQHWVDELQYTIYKA